MANTKTGAEPRMTLTVNDTPEEPIQGPGDALKGVGEVVAWWREEARQFAEAVEQLQARAAEQCETEALVRVGLREHALLYQQTPVGLEGEE